MNGYVFRCLQCNSFLITIDLQFRFVYSSNQDVISINILPPWAPSQPDNTLQLQCAVVQDHQARWGTIDCTHARKYVCEKPDTFQSFWDTKAIATKDKALISYIFETFLNTVHSKTMDTNLGNGRREYFLLRMAHEIIVSISRLSEFLFKTFCLLVANLELIT
jgi:hypothetical protein